MTDRILTAAGSAARRVALDRAYEERVYAGLLGKLVGVYLGRPVEGWPYPDIRERFGLVDRFVNGELGLPLIVADDDISGTLAFARVVEDNGGAVTAAAAGETWLDYIVEDRTILWWGGYGRSTEHTAYLNLKRGVPAPESGSIARNGRTLAEQIGAQIFSDAFALMAPGDPERAAALTRIAASVSHDGVALDAAAFFAAMRAVAFAEPDLGVLVEEGRRLVADPRLLALIDDVTASVAPGDDWQEVRSWVDRRYGYALYPGPCHALSNTAMSLAALLLAGDDFRLAVAVASSVGFDTDSNAGTVGCLTGVRLGLDAFRDAGDLRGPVADRALVVSADGGECVTDAARETFRIASSARLLAGDEPLARRARFSFDLPGAVHGFEPCPYAGDEASVRHVRFGQEGALAVAGGSVSTPVFLDPREQVSNFSTLASPTLYPTTTVRAIVSAPQGARARLYVLSGAGGDAGVRVTAGPWQEAGPAREALEWEVPELDGDVPFRLGLETGGAELLVHEVDWQGAPRRFRQEGVLLSSIWDTKPRGLAPWVSSARNFEADFAVTYSVSHPEPLGVATIGTRDWADCSVSSTLVFSLSEAAGIVVRSRGHRSFCAAVFTPLAVQLVDQDGPERTVLAEAPFARETDRRYDVRLACDDDTLTLHVDGHQTLTARTRRTAGGGAGFLIETGTMSADGFVVAARS